LLVLLAALGIGWWLGQRERSQKRHKEMGLQANYYRGLNYLLNQQTDEALELFIHALDVSPQTVDTHLALGSLFRRRGEVDKAIQIHQNLLAGKGLGQEQLMLAELELAHDFIKAGLLDRAEELLLDVAQQPNQQKAKATELLVDVYQREQDWHKALEVGAAANVSASVELAQRLSHFCCELAEESLGDGQEKQCLLYLKQAKRHNADNPRVSFLRAKLSMQQHHYADAKLHLLVMAQQDVQLMPEIIQPLQQCFAQLDDIPGWRAWLSQAMSLYPSTSLVLAQAKELSQDNDSDAAAYVTEQLRQRPSVKGFNYLIDLHMQWASANAKDSLQVLKGLTVALQRSKPHYRCRQCGFSGNSMHWQCPSCHQWGSTKPIYGLEGE
ncbi:MAG: lipopolysaccharide assembly protein LapB, partial [Oceanospirillaceae bacterium]|nr:lipopolysaccharide assembly protein LapB [Oceanospirillaceae bacterium]